MYSNIFYLFLFCFYIQNNDCQSLRKVTVLSTKETSSAVFTRDRKMKEIINIFKIKHGARRNSLAAIVSFSRWERTSVKDIL